MANPMMPMRRPMPPAPQDPMQEDEEARAAKYRAEAQEPQEPTPEQLKELMRMREEEKMRRAGGQAPNLGKRYAAGGNVRGGGIEQRGKTRGRFV